MNISVNKRMPTASVLAALFIVGCGGGGGGGSSPVPPTLSIADQAGFEPITGTGQIVLAVSLSTPSAQPVTVAYASSNGSATAGADYQSASGILSFAAGETSKAITITVNADTPFDERDETLFVTLSNPTSATLAKAQGVATIVDIVVRPDTAITTCADANSNTLACPQTGFAQQDAEFGRDITNNDNSDGRAGFSFAKLDSNGSDLAAGAPTWSCVRDNVTGLIWEIKTNDNGLRDRDHTYTWYNADGANNGGNPGALTGGTCTGGISCNSAAYVTAVNAAGLCGANNWRIPTTEELLSLSDYGTQTPPGIDTTYFNDVVISGPLTYWASETDAGSPGLAWVVDSAIGAAGNSSVAGKSSYYALIRLVRNP